MRCWAGSLVALLLAAGAAGAREGADAAPGARVALVIEVASPSADPPSAPARAEALAETLATLGFAVDALSNPDLAALRAGLADFRRVAEGAEAVVVYFRGPGVISGGALWLGPAGAPAAPEGAAPYDYASLGLVRDALDRADGLGLAILETGAGLPPSDEPAPPIDRILWATGPGTPPGALGRAFQRHAPTPGRSVEAVIAAVEADLARAGTPVERFGQPSLRPLYLAGRPAGALATSGVLGACTAPDAARLWDGLEATRRCAPLATFRRTCPLSHQATRAAARMASLGCSAGALSDGPPPSPRPAP